MLNVSRVHEAIETALERTGRADGERAYNIALHMTDWLEDLDTFYRFCEAPEFFDVEQVDELLNDFLSHVPERLAAAKMLLLNEPVDDMFELGAVRETEDDDDDDLDDVFDDM